MNKKVPLVSIGLIAYNRSHLISQAIESLLKQSYKNIELIISDDASSDNTEQICRYYVKKDRRIRFYKQKKNLGLPGNSNFVLQKARGQYFMWASDDDLWHKDFIKVLVVKLEENNQAVIAMSKYILFNGRYKQYVQFPYEEFLNGINLLKAYLTYPALLIWGIFRRSHLKSTGGFHEDSRPFRHKGSDHVTVFKVLLTGGLLYIDSNLLYKRDSGIALKRFKKLVQSPFEKDTIVRILRYLTYPLLLLYDCSWLLYFLWKSHFLAREKIIISLYVFFSLIKYQSLIFLEIIRGIFLVITSLFRRILFS